MGKGAGAGEYNVSSMEMMFICWCTFYGGEKICSQVDLKPQNRTGAGNNISLNDGPSCWLHPWRIVYSCVQESFFRRGNISCAGYSWSLSCFEDLWSKKEQGGQQASARMVVHGNTPMWDIRNIPREHRPPDAGNTKTGCERTWEQRKTIFPAYLLGRTCLRAIRFNYSSAYMPAVVGGERYVVVWNPNSTRVRCCFQGERSEGMNPTSASGMKQGHRAIRGVTRQEVEKTCRRNVLGEVNPGWVDSYCFALKGKKTSWESCCHGNFVVYATGRKWRSSKDERKSMGEWLLRRPGLKSEDLIGLRWLFFGVRRSEREYPTNRVLAFQLKSPKV